MKFSRASSVAAVLLLFLVGAVALAAPGTAPFAGLREGALTTHALVGAKIIVSPEKTIENGTVVLRNGVIVAVGDKIDPPADAQIHDVSGKTIYPGFIDAYTELSIDASRSGVKERAGANYWNENVVPQVDAADIYATDSGENRKLRSQGFTTRLVAPTFGIVKGTSALVTTGDGDGKHTILKDHVALHLKLTVNRHAGGYPVSPMGAYTLVRQVFYDAGWYREAWDLYEQDPSVSRPERNDALAAARHYLGGKEPVIIDAGDELFTLRADRISKEFDLNTIIRASGEEYRRLADIAATHRPMIVPLDFPKAPYVATPEAAAKATLERLMQWDLAPENPARLVGAGVKIALTTQGLKDPTSFLGALRKAVERGLSPQAALTALTVAPAEMFGVADRLGTIEVGKAANLVVASGDLLTSGKAKVVETWVDGTRYEIETKPLVDVRGKWKLELTKIDGSKEELALEIKGQPAKLSGKLSKGDKSIDLIKPHVLQLQFATTFKGEPLGYSGVVLLSAVVTQTSDDNKSLIGTAVFADGQSADVAATLLADKKEESKKDDAADKKPADDKAAEKAGDEKGDKPDAAANADDDEESDEDSPADKEGEEGAESKGDEAKAKDDKGTDKPTAKADSGKGKKPPRAIAEVNYPLGPYGRKAPPEQPAAVLFRNATVWTCGASGNLENADVLVEHGKITAVGKGLSTPAGAVVVDATGKHLSPGIIDCHAHIATDGGVNESGQTISAEVRVADFVDPNDINIYRQIAGGVTSSNILHGSSNTIGGQCQVVKFRWGASPEEMKFAEAPPSIKFALGENVKRSNARPSNRYPQSRMGVEQLVRDAFTAAQEYRRAQEQWKRTKSGLPPRTDLELEALAEVVEGKRMIHCHSYRQDEILAFMRTCEAFGVRIGTLQHILEGYKVADAIARHGAGASSFSDWWAYKFEVFDAIPYNGALMHNAGIVVSFNSDDAEMGRRLNLEAAKAIRYGGLSPEEALKFVTLNPAKQIGVDRYVGSIEPGKHADVVLWSSSPLSSYSRVEQTWIDGRRYFDVVEDQQQRKDVQSLHAALVQRVLNSGEAMAGPNDQKVRESDLWPREDEFCHTSGGHHHDEDH